MVGVLILTHGNLARELLASARKITARDLERFEALSLSWSDGIENAQQQVAEAVERLGSGQGVLVLTDIFGGTPSNIAMAFRQSGRVEVISGVNLPMVVRLGCLRGDGMGVEDMATWIREKGQSSIHCSSELPRANPPGESAPSDPQKASIDDCTGSP